MSADPRVQHLVRRAGFGATPDEAARYSQLGYSATRRELFEFSTIPDDVDGRVLSELFTVAPEVRSAPARPDRTDDATALSAQEEADLAERLRAETGSNPLIVLASIAVTATVLAFFVVDTLRNAPQTFVAIVVIGVLAVVLDSVWTRMRSRAAAGEHAAEAEA